MIANCANWKGEARKKALRDGKDRRKKPRRKRKRKLPAAIAAIVAADTIATAVLRILAKLDRKKYGLLKFKKKTMILKHSE